MTDLSVGSPTGTDRARSVIELRTPLCVVAGRTQLLLRRLRGGKGSQPPRPIWKRSRRPWSA
jgi:hypothetical protein